MFPHVIFDLTGVGTQNRSYRGRVFYGSNDPTNSFAIESENDWKGVPPQVAIHR